jgi:hypothetical protein
MAISTDKAWPSRRDSMSRHYRCLPIRTNASMTTEGTAGQRRISFACPGFCLADAAS